MSPRSPLQPPASKPDWPAAKPEAIPPATFQPAALAFGVVLFFWGLVASTIVSLVGLVVIGVAIAGWIGEMRHEAD